MNKTEFIPYAATNRFSKLVIDYVNSNENLKSFYDFEPHFDGINQAIEARKNKPINRTKLVAELKIQYQNLKPIPLVNQSIDHLLNDNTFTICTAHQPNIATGYLYFFYKILQAIKTANELNKKHPDLKFVPVYYMGTDDHDIEEIGSFNFGENIYKWDGDGTKNAVGSMFTASLKPLFDKLFSDSHFSGINEQTLKKLLTQAYEGHKTVQEATHFLLHELLGTYGLVILNPNTAVLKSEFITVMTNELINESSEPLVLESQQNLKKLGYSTQSVARKINLFYFTGNARERIEKNEQGLFQITNTTLRFSQNELLEELQQHPEKFSPNVILRPLYQESILPNIAFIGGGSELAYWLEMKKNFEANHVFYPCILLRQSYLLVPQAAQKLLLQLQLTVTDLFLTTPQLTKKIITNIVNENWETTEETLAMQPIFEKLTQKAIQVDSTLKPTVEASFAKLKKQFAVLQLKMYRAEKKKNKVTIERIERLNQLLFPKQNLQERIENFMPYYLQFGSSFFDKILEDISIFSSNFTLLFLT